jgi:hypothetical protein
MSKNILFKRDLLYPTENLFEPGSIYIEIMHPDKQGRMSVLVESKTGHSPIKYIDNIVRIMQSDIFDRILISVKSSVDLFFKANDELKKEYGGKKYVLVRFDGDKPTYKGVDDLGF